MLGNQEHRTEGIRKQASELIEQAYNRGYTEGYSKAENDYHAKTEDDRQSSYELGLNMAWDAARKIMLDEGYSKEELGYIFSDYDNPLHAIDVHGILRDYSASEAIEKLCAYEEKKKQEADEIHVGDEVILNENVISNYKPNTKAVVIRIDCRSKCSYNVMFANGDTEWIEKNEVRKTGKHFSEIADVMFYMKI